MRRILFGGGEGLARSDRKRQEVIKRDHVCQALEGAEGLQERARAAGGEAKQLGLCGAL